MDFDDSFYQQWKAQKINNRRLFAEKLDVASGNIKIFSSTALNEQTENETFSLRLSESYVDETQESFENNQQKKTEEIILISDSSVEENSLINEKSDTRKNYVNTAVKEKPNKLCIIESSDDELPNFQVQETLQKSIRKISTSKKSTEQFNKTNVIIEESDSELEQSKVPEIIKETIAESITLSDRKKKEILQWLSTNFDSSRCNSSCSTESAIADSRKSGISSGNSSLERLEQNYETPNNRGKLSKLTIDRQKKNLNETKNQTKIDEYFPNGKKGQLKIVNEITPKSKDSHITPVRKIKFSSKDLILSETTSTRNKTPTDKKLDSTPVNNVLKKKIPESNVTSMVDKSSDKRIKKTKSEKSSESSKNDHSDTISENSVKLNPRNIIIPESESFGSDNELNVTEDPNIKKCGNIDIKILSENNSLISNVNLIKTSDEDIFQSTSDSNSKSKESPNNDHNNTINDCADILENLYGTTWRNKVNTLVSMTEPRKNTTKTVIKKVQTEKKSCNRPALKDFCNKELSDKENDHVINKGNVQTEKVKNSHRQKDNFINDNESSESSPDCSYYTALTNPISSQQNVPVKIKENDHQKKWKELCDSESDLDDANQKQKDHCQRKLSFNSSNTSSTSEFDPEDIIPPKSTKVKKLITFSTVKKTSYPTKKPSVRKSFIASLSKDVPLENADFKAMVYRVKYPSLKEELCKVLFKLFNEKVFDYKLPEDMSIEWSIRLRGTAGKCYNKQSLKALGNTVRSSRIVLASKVLDSPDRLRDTLIHEMCHAATWLINNVSDGHGNFWKAWANKAMKVFPELPTISRCHNYEIQTKYTYKCTGCGYTIGRHSKSLDLNSKRCGYCYGTFELLINKVTKTGRVQKKSTAQTKEPSGFALYVKENYQLVKQSRSSMKHAEVMKTLGQQFSAVKITPKPANKIRNNDDESP
ncbi:germ cell nuclear acidic protein-like [Phymastichus coffea]|uniref:germ cell nuclear acidic protein-like n=1 Tax=Phymastichus coffea TaxID=108790 RepID=UPI00273B8E02|nr:germ cell nuclear acidic protein-like [Phymastichus coffea]